VAGGQLGLCQFGLLVQGLLVDWATGWASGADLGDKICTVFCSEDSPMLDLLSKISLKCRSMSSFIDCCMLSITYRWSLPRSSSKKKGGIVNLSDGSDTN